MLDPRQGMHWPGGGLQKTQRKTWDSTPLG